MLDKGLGRVVRNGQLTHFWVDKWLENMALQDIAIQLIHRHCLSQSIADNWMVGSGWKWHDLNHYLNPSTLLRLAAIVVSTKDDEMGQLAWLPSPHKVSTVKSAPYLQAGWVHMRDESIHKSIWKLDIQENDWSLHTGAVAFKDVYK